MGVLIFDNTILIPILSVVGAALVIVLAYLAQAIAKQGDTSIEVRRMAYINIYEVRLLLRASTTRKGEHEFSDIFLAAEIDKVLLPITGVAALPLAQGGSTHFLLKSKKGYGFRIRDGHPFEAVFEFHIPEDNDMSRLNKVFIVATDEKGRKRKAEISLRSTSSQVIRFRKAS